jgi:hypothetical protein
MHFEPYFSHARLGVRVRVRVEPYFSLRVRVELYFSHARLRVRVTYTVLW